jgi:hypothetical protein
MFTPSPPRIGVDVLLAVIVVSVVLLFCVGLRVKRRRHTPRALRGDWWTPFEHEFRAYVRRLEQSRGPRQRRNDRGSIGQ